MIERAHPFLDGKPKRMLIGGHWVDALSGETFDSVNPATGEPPRSVHETIVTADHGSERVLACSRCGHRYCGHGGNYKQAALMDEAPITTIPSAEDPAFYVDENWVLRRYCCPGCHVQVCAEVAQSDGPIEPEMALA